MEGTERMRPCEVFLSALGGSPADSFASLLKRRVVHMHAQLRLANEMR